ncbi:MAG TPA: hypothetical protein VFF98_09120 [Novosphingobium sp.]|nr:hypothetical protein [Novosphingobium sp.]
MNMTRDRLHAIGWGMTLTVCLALLVALTMRVNAVKSEVHLADRQIATLQQEKMFLETEFETRSSQQQLRAFNDVDFGYEAPTAGQYLESERQLAALGKPAGPDAPAPVRMASADDGAGQGAGDAQPVRALVALAAEKDAQPHKLADRHPSRPARHSEAVEE